MGNVFRCFPEHSLCSFVDQCDVQKIIFLTGSCKIYQHKSSCVWNSLQKDKRQPEATKQYRTFAVRATSERSLQATT